MMGWQDSDQRQLFYAFVKSFDPVESVPISVR
jgi:hypothetical protein